MVYTWYMPTITICSSANFYKKVIEVADQLEPLGFDSIVPLTARKMQASGDYDASHYRTWLQNDNDYGKKAALMRTHFDEITKGDAVLIVNEEKHGIANYIGGNVLMEMAVAFHLKKPIFILNEIPEESSFLEEIKGMMPIVLHGNAQDLPATYSQLTR
jgi:hypothetical protein